MVTPGFAVLTRPGAESRRGEIEDMRPVLAEHFEKLYRIIEPGTLDGGDICQVDKHFFIRRIRTHQPAGCAAAGGNIRR